jgi:voltage-gated potassium channel Kch
MGRTGQQLRARTTRAVRGDTRTGPSPVRPPERSRTRLGERLRYVFDNSMSRGTPALVAWLTGVTVVLIVVFAVLTTVLGLRSPDTTPEPRGFAYELFYSLLHALDPGTVAGDDGSWRYIGLMLLLTVAGLFIVSALIGVIAAGIDTRLADLRRGRSLVLESDHTVVLGWSEAIFTVIGELTIANASRRRPVLVVLADRDKVEMEDAIRAKVPDLRGTRVICRSGSPMDVDDVRLSSHGTARSVIVLAPEGSDDPDSEVIKTLLALTHTAGEGRAPAVVAEIRNPRNLEAARLVGTERTVLLDIRDTVAKLLVQTSRQSGAAAVYTDLFDYDGDEIYFLEHHDLAGTTYGEALLAFETAALLGVVADGVSRLNPPHDTVLDDQALILLAEDDAGLAGLQRCAVAPDLSALGREVAGAPAATSALLLGWNDRAAVVLTELDKYAAPGSTVTVVTAFGEPILPPTVNLAVTVTAGATTDRAVLDRHVVADLDHVIVLCYSEHLAAQAADARTLVTLLHVRDILGRLGVDIPVISEMLDDRNRVLAQVAHVDDVVVSGEIISLVVAQLSEDPRLEAVFAELLGDAGSEIYLRPAPWYVVPGAEVAWATVAAGARARGETPIGFKRGADVVVNPPKSQRLTLGADDRVVVLAES